jgi:hypothetical protein
MNLKVEDIVGLVEEIDSQDPIDWAMLSIDEHAATELIVNSVVDNWNNQWRHFPEPDRVQILIATIAKLTLENFSLNVKLHQ